MTTILVRPTVEQQLALRLEGGRRREKIAQLLKPGVGRTGLFLVHDGDGGTLLYVNLAAMPSGRLRHRATRQRSLLDPLHTRPLPDSGFPLCRANPQGPAAGPCASWAACVREGDLAFRGGRSAPGEETARRHGRHPRCGGPRGPQRRVGRIAKQRGARFQSLREGRATKASSSACLARSPRPPPKIPA